MIALTVILAIAGLALVVFGADFLVDGASSIARKSGLSEFVIGLVIVGFGTSCPELVVSLTGAIEGNADISIGNVIGSNIFNTLLILGATALLIPIQITSSNKKIDIPVTVAVTLIFILTGFSHTLFGIGSSDCISRPAGIFFLVLFIVYVTYSIKAGKNENDGDDIRQKDISLVVSLLMIAGGLAGLIFGGKLFVDSSVKLAKAVNVSDKVIAITLLAGGTSLPELVTSIVAAIKGKSQMALGNILGSNVFNILLILGISATITPLSLASINPVDVAVLMSSILFVWLAALTFRRDTLDRTEGAIMILMFILYYIWLFIKN